MAAADQQLDGHIDGIEVVDHDGVIVRLVERTVDQHDGDGADAGADLTGRDILGDVDDAVDVVAREKFELFQLPVSYTQRDVYKRQRLHRHRLHRR